MFDKMLSQESRIKLQTLINHPEITHVSINDSKSPSSGVPYTYVHVHADCELYTLQSILSCEGLEFGKEDEFICEHDDFWSVGHCFHGSLEGCDIGYQATRRVKKEAPQQEGATKENSHSDYIEEEAIGQ